MELQANENFRLACYTKQESPLAIANQSNIRFAVQQLS